MPENVAELLKEDAVLLIRFRVLAGLLVCLIFMMYVGNLQDKISE